MIATQGRAVIVIPAVPPRECWPNHARRLHWAEKGKAARAWREAAGWATRAAVLENFDAFAWIPSAPEVVLNVLIAWPKGQRRLDDDNAWAAFKPARDGIADVLQINDRKFKIGWLHQDRGEGTVTVILRGVDDRL